jgi:hypothetical protein
LQFFALLTGRDWGDQACQNAHVPPQVLLGSLGVHAQTNVVQPATHLTLLAAAEAASQAASAPLIAA